MLLPVALRAQITTFPWYEHFDDGAMPTNITLIDADGDGYNWSYGSSEHNHTYAGSDGCATSASYASAALTPDNWMILPAVTLPDDHQGYTLSFFVRGQDANWAAEHYSVYISTTAGAAVTDFPASTAVISDEVATGYYVKKSIDLSSYTGTIYIAFRHHNCTDQFRLNIDEIRIGTLEAPYMAVYGSDQLRTGEETVFTAVTEADSIQWYIGSDMQAGATSSTFTHTFTTAGNYQVIAMAHNDAGNTYDTLDVTVIDCSIAQALPFTADFSEGFGCWDVASDSTQDEGWFISDEYLQNPVGQVLSISGDATYYSYGVILPISVDNWIVTPTLAAPSTGNSEVAWDVLAGGASLGYAGDHYTVYLIQGNDTTPIFSETLTENESIFTSRVAALPTTLTGNFKVAFRHHDNEEGYMIILDNIEVRPCAVPTVSLQGPSRAEINTEVTFTAVSPNATQYAWTVDGTSVNEATNTLTYTFTTEGDHYVSVVASNAVGSSDAITDTINVYSCPVISEFPYEEGFENGIDCWTAISNNTANISRMGIYMDDPEDDPEAYEGTHWFGFSSYTRADDYNQYLITPELNLTEGTTYHVKFWYRASHSSQTESFTVLTSSTDNQISSFTNEIGFNDEVGASDWEEFDAVIPAGTKYIAINYNSEYAYYLFVDDFSIEASGVGINDVENVNLTLSPNPASNTVKVSANGIEGTVNVAIVDLNGRTIMEQNGNAQSFTFDVTNVARGAYFVRLTGENVNAVRKLIVK